MGESEQYGKVEVRVNGKNIGLNPYVRGVFIGVITALVSTLKNTDRPGDIEIRISGIEEKRS